MATPSDSLGYSDDGSAMISSFSTELDQFIHFSNDATKEYLSAITSRLPADRSPNQCAEHMQVFSASVEKSLTAMHVALSENLAAVGQVNEAGVNSERWTIGLPVELLEQIFSYLALVDRKSARLVCKQWQKVSGSKRLIKNDWIVVSLLPKYQTLKSVLNAVRDAFSASETMPTNMQFKVVADHAPVLEAADFATFWPHFGAKIEHVIFDKTCILAWSRSDFQLFLKQCTSLMSLSILGLLSQKKCPDDDDGMPQSKSLESLRVVRLCHIDELSQAQPLWQMIGRLRELEVPLDGGGDSALLVAIMGDSGVEDLHLSIERGMTAERLRDLNSRLVQVSSTVRVRSIRMTSARNDRAVATCHLLSSHRGTITKLEVITSASDDWLCSRMNAQGNPQEEQFVNTFPKTIRTLKHLKHLSLSFPSRLSGSMARNTYRALLDFPHLETLKLKGCDWEPIGGIQIARNIFTGMPLPGLPTDICLKQLHLKRFPYADQLLNLAPVLPNLTVLKLCEIRNLSDGMVQRICERYVALESLTIDRCPKITDDALCYSPDGIGQQKNESSKQIQESSKDAQQLSEVMKENAQSYLTQLKSLTELHLSGRFTCRTISVLCSRPGREMSLGKQSLRNLSLAVLQCTDDALLGIAVSNSLLESFSLSPSGRGTVDFDRVSLAGHLQFVKHLKRLRSYAVPLAAGVEVRRAMKAACPSLHYVNGVTLLV